MTSVTLAKHWPRTGPTSHEMHWMISMNHMLAGKMLIIISYTTSVTTIVSGESMSILIKIDKIFKDIFVLAINYCL